VLLIWLDQARELTVGQLGTFRFQSGWYAYTGSALGPGGLDARLARHARKEKRIHWHVDYLLEHGLLVCSWQAICPIRLECGWAAALSRSQNAQVYVCRFGASDCRCPGHLIYWPESPNYRHIHQILEAASPKGCDLRRTAYSH
jgi:Uri superfamily endonuclease